MSYKLEDLKAAAKCQPNNADLLRWAVNEIERLQAKAKAVQEDNGKIRGRMHDQWIEQNKIKAEAVREAVYCIEAELDATRQDEWSSQLSEYANKLERGEL